MHSGGSELTKLTNTWLEDNLTRHRGDRRIPLIYVCPTGYHVHFMVMSRENNVANAGTTWRKLSMTLTIFLLH